MPVVKNARLRHRIIDECLRNPYRPFPDIEALRETCEEKLFGNTRGGNISKSTIEKDLREMKEEYDAPIQYSREQRGYYYADDSYTLESIPLSAEDAEALRFAALTLDQFKHLAIFNQFTNAIRKIFDRIYISEKLEDEEINRFVQFETVPEVQGSQWLNSIFAAIKNSVELSFTYDSFSSNQVKSYLVHPYLLKEYRHRWYLIAYEPSKQNMLTFELGRIQELSAGTAIFERREDFNAEEFFKHAFGITVIKGIPEEVLLEFDQRELRYILSQPLHLSQELVSQGAGSAIIRIRVFITQELVMALLGFGSTVKVLKPHSLAETLKKIHLESAGPSA